MLSELASEPISSLAPRLIPYLVLGLLLIVKVELLLVLPLQTVSSAK